MSAYLDTARRVIRAEAAALQALVDVLDTRFDTVVERVLNTSGRVIVTGIGKSGHIGHKIAATLASTGTPAQFVHPAEASHGDLGMVTTQDTVLAISNSGEAPELANMLAYARRFGIPLIGLTSQPDSTLAQHSDILLLIPALPEACGTGVVPTSSTTMTLALGDALALALMEHRRFTPENFRDFHPGGKLGAQLSRVGDLMHTGAALPLVGEDTPMAEAIIEITEKSFGVAGVTDAAGALIGIITDGDLRRNMEGLMSRTARQVMTSNPRTISADALAEEAVAMMNRDGGPKITSLFVTNERHPTGLLHIHDCLRVGLG